MNPPAHVVLGTKCIARLDFPPARRGAHAWSKLHCAVRPRSPAPSLTHGIKPMRFPTQLFITTLSDSTSISGPKEAPRSYQASASMALAAPPMSIDTRFVFFQRNMAPPPSFAANQTPSGPLLRRAAVLPHGAEMISRDIVTLPVHIGWDDRTQINATRGSLYSGTRNLTALFPCSSSVAFDYIRTYARLSISKDDECRQGARREVGESEWERAAGSGVWSGSEDGQAGVVEDGR